MNWKLIFVLSLFGVAMGLASLFGLTGRGEPLLWLGIFVLYAWMISKHAPGKYFLHGFLVSLLNGIWVALIHAAFFSTFIKNNPQMQANLAVLPKGIDPRILNLAIGPIVGALTGVVAGLFAFFASKIFKSPGAKVTT